MGARLLFTIGHALRDASLRINELSSFSKAFKIINAYRKQVVLFLHIKGVFTGKKVIRATVVLLLFVLSSCPTPVLETVSVSDNRPSSETLNENPVVTSTVDVVILELGYCSVPGASYSENLY